MKQTLTIGKRISLGFGLLLLATGLVGALAAYNMNHAARSAKTIAGESVPESMIAARLATTFGNVRVAARDFALTFDAAHIAKARKLYEDIDASIADGKTLVATHPQLNQLREAVQTVEPLLREYLDLLGKMEASGDRVTKARALTAQVAIDLNNALGRLVQNAKLEFEQTAVKPNAAVAQLAQPFLLYLQSSEAQLKLNFARIANWKGQTYRDTALFDVALKELGELEKQLAALAPLVTSPDGKADLQSSTELAAKYKGAIGDFQSSFVAFADNSKRRGEIGILASKTLDDVLATSSGRTKQSAADSSTNLVRSTSVVVSGLVIAFSLGVVTALLIVRSTTKVLNRVTETIAGGADQTAAAAAQVSASSQTLAEGSSEQAASLEETSASLEEMASMTKRNAESAQQAKRAAGETRQVADTGAEQMQAMVTAMDSIKAASADIAKILKTIDEIAFQTNILALNAAVEAARAGEAGAGFAVVADEVRALAQRCAAAAKETAVKIEDSVAKSNQGSQISADVAASFATIQERVRQLDTLVAEIAQASNEQSQGIGQVTTAVSQMDKVTQSNASTAEESAAAAEELNAQSGVMKDAVTELRLLVGNTTKSSGAKGRPTEIVTPSVRSRQSGKLSPMHASHNGKNGHNGHNGQNGHHSYNGQNGHAKSSHRSSAAQPVPDPLATAGTNGSRMHDDFFQS